MRLRTRVLLLFAATVALCYHLLRPAPLAAPESDDIVASLSFARDFAASGVAGPFWLPGDISAASKAANVYAFMRDNFFASTTSFRARYGLAPLNLPEKQLHLYTTELLALMTSPPVLDRVRAVIRSRDVDLSFVVAVRKGVNDNHRWHTDIETSLCPDSVIVWFPVFGEASTGSKFFAMPGSHLANRLAQNVVSENGWDKKSVEDNADTLAAHLKAKFGIAQSQVRVFSGLFAEANRTSFVMINGTTWHATTNTGARTSRVAVAASFMAAHCVARFPVGYDSHLNFYAPLLPAVVRVLPALLALDQQPRLSHFNSYFAVNNTRHITVSEAKNTRDASLAAAAAQRLTATSGPTFSSAEAGSSVRAFAAKSGPPCLPHCFPSQLAVFLVSSPNMAKLEVTVHTLVAHRTAHMFHSHDDEEFVMVFGGVMKATRLPAGTYRPKGFDAHEPPRVPPHEQVVLLPSNFMLLSPHMHHTLTAVTPVPPAAQWQWRGFITERYQNASRAWDQELVYLSVRFLAHAAEGALPFPVRQDRNGLASGTKYFWKTGGPPLASEAVFLNQSTFGFENVRVYNRALALQDVDDVRAIRGDLLLVVTQGAVQFGGRGTEPRLLEAFDMVFLPAGSGDHTATGAKSETKVALFFVFEFLERVPPV